MISTIQLTDLGLTIFGDDIAEAGFAEGDTVEVSSFAQASVIRNLTPQQIEVLRLVRQRGANGSTARFVGDTVEAWTSRNKIGYDIAHAVLQRLYNRGLVERNGKPALYTITDIGEKALDAK